MNRASSQRRDREAAFRLDLLLDAAEEVFLQKGFAGAPVEEIARRAGVALATLYKSFPSKEDAYVRVINRRVDHFHAWLEKESAEGVPLERLEAVVRGTLAYFHEHDDLFRLYFAPHGVPWNLRSGLGEEVFGKYWNYVSYVEEICRLVCPSKKATARLRALAIAGTLNNVIVDSVANDSAPALPERAPAVWGLIKSIALAK